jgi:hypothetical protein
MFSGDLRFATKDFYDISHKGDDIDAYRVGFLLENTWWHNIRSSSRMTMKFLWWLLRKPSLGEGSGICNSFTDASLIYVSKDIYMAIWIFSGDHWFATEAFYDISYKGDDRDAYRVGFLLENTSWHDIRSSSRVTMMFLRWLLRKPSLGKESGTCNSFTDASLIYVSKVNYMAMWMFSGDHWFDTEDFYDILHKGDDRDAYRVGFLLENTSWHNIRSSSRMTMKFIRWLLRKPSLGKESGICNLFTDASLAVC